MATQKMPRQKKKKNNHGNNRIWFWASECKYDVILDRVESLRWKLVEDERYESKVNMYWIDVASIHERFRKIQPWQTINHFPGMPNIARKNRMGQNLNNMLKLFPKEYAFYPRTWVLPGEMSDFRSQFDEKGNSLGNKIYIIKPDAGCQGRGIFLTKSFDTVPHSENVVAQLYIKRPLLLDGFKFDLRLYCLVTSVKPLRIYLFQDGLVRMCTEEYVKPTKQNLSMVCMHLTNYAVNKRNSNFQQPSAKSSEDQQDEGSKRSLYWFMNMIRSEHGDSKADWLWRRMGTLCVRTILSIMPTLSREYDLHFKPFENIPSAKSSSRGCDSGDEEDSGDAGGDESNDDSRNIGRIKSEPSFSLGDSSGPDVSGSKGPGKREPKTRGSRCFEVLGFDIMIDSKLKPWLIEVNHLPSFGTDSPLDQDIKERLMAQVFACLPVQPDDEQAFINYHKEEATKRLNAKREKEKLERETTNSFEKGLRSGPPLPPQLKKREVSSSSALPAQTSPKGRKSLTQQSVNTISEGADKDLKPDDSLTSTRSRSPKNEALSSASASTQHLYLVEPKVEAREAVITQTSHMASTESIMAPVASTAVVASAVAVIGNDGESGPMVQRDRIQVITMELEKIYTQHSKEKLTKIKRLLAKYAGREEEFLLFVCSKYGVIPSTASAEPASQETVGVETPPDPLVEVLQEQSRAVEPVDAAKQAASSEMGRTSLVSSLSEVASIFPAESLKEEWRRPSTDVQAGSYVIDSGDMKATANQIDLHLANMENAEACVAEKSLSSIVATSVTAYVSVHEEEEEERGKSQAHQGQTRRPGARHARSLSPEQATGMRRSMRKLGVDDETAYREAILKQHVPTEDDEWMLKEKEMLAQFTQIFPPPPDIDSGAEGVADDAADAEDNDDDENDDEGMKVEFKSKAVAISSSRIAPSLAIHTKSTSKAAGYEEILFQVFLQDKKQTMRLRCPLPSNVRASDPRSGSLPPLENRSCGAGGNAYPPWTMGSSNLKQNPKVPGGFGWRAPTAGSIKSSSEKGSAVGSSTNETDADAQSILIASKLKSQADAAKRLSQGLSVAHISQANRSNKVTSYSGFMPVSVLMDEDADGVTNGDLFAVAPSSAAPSSSSFPSYPVPLPLQPQVAPAVGVLQDQRDGRRARYVEKDRRPLLLKGQTGGRFLAGSAATSAYAGAAVTGPNININGVSYNSFNGASELHAVAAAPVLRQQLFQFGQSSPGIIKGYAAATAGKSSTVTEQRGVEGSEGGMRSSSLVTATRKNSAPSAPRLTVEQQPHDLSGSQELLLRQLFPGWF